MMYFAGCAGIDASAQWVYKYNAAGKEILYYEVPKQQPPPPATSTSVGQTNNTVTTKRYGSSADNIVAISYVFSEGFVPLEHYKGDGRWGFMKNGLLEPIVGEFEQVRKFREGMAGVKKSGKWGFVDRTRKVVITPIYDDISYFSEGMAGVSLNKKYGFIDYTGKLIIPMEYDDVTGLFEAGKILVSKNNESFYINTKGEKVSPDYKAPPYKFPPYYAYGVTAVKIWDQWFFYNERGDAITEARYSDVIAFNDGMAAVKLKEKWGFMDVTGKEVIAPQYDEIAALFENGVAFVIKNGKPFAIDKTGNPIVADMVPDGRYGFSEVEDKTEVFPLFANCTYDVSSGKAVDWVVKNLTGKQVVPLQLVFSHGLSKVMYKGKWGFIDLKGKLTIPAEFDEVITPFQDGNATVVKNHQQFKIDIKGNQAGPGVAATAKPPSTRVYEKKKKFSEGLAVVNIGDEFGYVDESNNEVVPLLYDYAYDFAEGMAGVKQNNKWGFIDKTGKLIVPIVYDELYLRFSEGLASVKLNGKWGFIDKQGKTIIPFKYDQAAGLQQNLACVSIDEKWGFIDKAGKVIIPIKYQHQSFFREGVAGVKYNGKWGFIDETGKEISPFIYDDLKDFVLGSGFGKLNGEWIEIRKPANNSTSVKDAKKSLAIENTRKENKAAPIAAVKAGSRVDAKKVLTTPVYDTLIVTRTGDKFGFKDSEGNTVVPLIYDYASEFKNGMAGVKQGEKYGFIDRSGQVAIPLTYDKTGFYFSEDCVSMAVNNKWGFITNKEKIIVPFIYEETVGFNEGLAAVKLNGLWGFVDKAGKVVIPFKYDRTFGFHEGLSSVRLNSKWGYINKKGEEVIPVIYDDVYSFTDGKVKVILNGQSIYLDRNGNKVTQ